MIFWTAIKIHLESDEIKDRVQADIDAGNEAGVTGTPGFTLNGEIVDLNQFIFDNLDVSRLEVAEEETTPEVAEEEVSAE